MGKVERGANAGLSARTLRRLDTGLKWAEGSAIHVLGGGEPVELDVAPKKRARAPKKAAKTPGASPKSRTATDKASSNNANVAPTDINNLIELFQRYEAVATRYPTTPAGEELAAINTDFGKCVAEILHTWMRTNLTALPRTPDTADISNALVGMIRRLD